ncbi:MAG: guanylate kinase [Candidatus Rariloculaceae bacterium]
MAESGRLIVLAAPSGAGKTTLVHKLLERDLDLAFSISYTTRPQRPTEEDGKDYFFVEDSEFAAMRERGEFLEYAEVFGNWYGTSERYVESLLDAGHSVLLEIDWQGAEQIRERRADALSVFILPPGRAELERRLRGRKTDSDEVIAGRLNQALSDMAHWRDFGFVVINDDVEVAADELAGIVSGKGGDNRTDNESNGRRVAELLGSSG